MESQKNQVRLLDLTIEWKSPQEYLDQIDLFLDQNKMNTIALLTVPVLLEASESEEVQRVLQNADLLLPAEAEIFQLLKEGDGRMYAEDALYLLFSRFTEQHSRVMILEDTKEDAEHVKKLFQERYPELNILGCAGTVDLEETAADHLMNEINSQEIDLIISSLLGTAADAFMLQHKAKITPGIWINLGRHRKLQNRLGLKIGKMKSLSMTMNWNSLIRNQFEKS